MGQKGHIIVQKGLKMHEKRQKIEFLDLKNLLFGGIFFSGIGGYPPPPLNRQSLCSKKLSLACTFVQRKELYNEKIHRRLSYF